MVAQRLALLSCKKEDPGLC
uniref:Uncharacterized protein n=1 Tax=Anguilla anguilla TaxID=7936 RepID=A0A0E9W203_ANGAN